VSPQIITILFTFGTLKPPAAAEAASCCLLSLLQAQPRRPRPGQMRWMKQTVSTVSVPLRAWPCSQQVLAPPISNPQGSGPVLILLCATSHADGSFLVVPEPPAIAPPGPPPPPPPSTQHQHQQSYDSTDRHASWHAGQRLCAAPSTHNTPHVIPFPSLRPLTSRAPLLPFTPCFNPSQNTCLPAARPRRPREQQQLPAPAAALPRPRAHARARRACRRRLQCDGQQPATGRQPTRGGRSLQAGTQPAGAWPGWQLPGGCRAPLSLACSWQEGCRTPLSLACSWQEGCRTPLSLAYSWQAVQDTPLKSPHPH
jgi:hypothetical protein